MSACKEAEAAESTIAGAGWVVDVAVGVGGVRFSTVLACDCGDVAEDCDEPAASSLSVGEDELAADELASCEDETVR